MISKDIVKLKEATKFARVPSLKLAIFIPYMEISALTRDLITQETEKVLLSKENFRFNDVQPTRIRECLMAVEESFFIL